MKKQYSSDLKVNGVEYYLKIKNYTKTCKFFLILICKLFEKSINLDS